MYVIKILLDNYDITIFTEIQFEKNKVIKKAQNHFIIQLIGEGFTSYKLPYFLETEFESSDEFILFTIHLLQRQTRNPKYINTAIIRYLLDFITDQYLKETYILRLL